MSQDNEKGQYDGSYAANPRTSEPNPGPPIAESTGYIASDSLAAESLKSSSSGFGSDPLHSGRVVASDVPGRSSTATTTDSSNAVKLGPTSDARGRLGNESGTYTTPADEKALSGGADYSGSGGSSGVYNTSSGGPQSSYGGEAPRAAYASDQIDGNAAPKGRNISEGGFDSEDAPNASFNNKIGGKNDPARLAEEQFERANARSGAAAGYDNANASGLQSESNQGGFGNLGGDTSA